MGQNKLAKTISIRVKRLWVTLEFSIFACLFLSILDLLLVSRHVFMLLYQLDRPPTGVNLSVELSFLLPWQTVYRCQLVSWVIWHFVVCHVSLHDILCSSCIPCGQVSPLFLIPCSTYILHRVLPTAYVNAWISPLQIVILFPSQNTPLIVFC